MILYSINDTVVYMQYFTEDYLDFMAELAVNNNKQWFDANRDRYHTFVREPFLKFTEDLSTELRNTYRPDIVQPANKLMYRINRDVRFAKDKTPYKTGMSASLSAIKNDEMPGFFVSLGIEEGLAMAGGVYMPSKESLLDIRRSLQADSNTLTKLTDAKSFKQHWGELRGDKNKILPAEFKSDSANNPWLFYKQYYYWTELPFDTAYRPDLIKFIANYLKTAHPINQYFHPIMLETKARLAEENTNK